MNHRNLLFLTCAVIGAAHAQSVARLTLEDLASVAGLQQAALSPDGRTLAAVRQPEGRQS